MATVAEAARRRDGSAPPFEEMRTTEALIDHVDCDMEFTGALTEQQRVRMLEIADSSFRGHR